MIKLLHCERKKNVEDILGDVMIHSQGFLDTTYGAVVTSDTAMGFLRLQHAAKQRAKEQQEKKDAETGANMQAERQKKRAARQTLELHRALVRSKRYFEPVVAIRSLQERAVRAKLRFVGEHLDRAVWLNIIDNGNF
ncbi:hypothetical protein BWQ96_00140 [Gracilariopsis chorda]|uniref:Uncharacterized protein n=1 Tax=Gracilariopsis chorda TaxID=448386 RepID=A0A2V3JCF6_9FLOR|nr:hypothetical protein BWQ96_00140 [Gracilariopsis chorda]|eukprot:PXF49980.1 hypothetical protein BWQ96_00140 [Gracilariopsis chorda]